MKILPSLISADILNLEATITRLNSHCDGFHIDVMDDHFVPNLTWGPMFVNAMKKKATVPLCVHLMVEKPASWLDRLSLTEEDTFIFHREVYATARDCKQLIDAVRAKGWKVGIAINPETDVTTVQDLAQFLDSILVMSVHPGFSGQTFIEETKEKMQQLSTLKEQLMLSFTISVDGGVNKENIASLKLLGVTHVAAASAIFGAADMVIALQDLKKRVA